MTTVHFVQIELMILPKKHIVQRIYLQMRDKTNAADCFQCALNVYNIVWENEPELLQAKVTELRKMRYLACGNR